MVVFLSRRRASAVGGRGKGRIVALCEFVAGAICFSYSCQRV